MKLRVLQTADVHLGRRFAYLGENAAAHGERVADTFRRACQFAQEQGCHLMLIAGDLFDSPRVERRWVLRCLESFAGLNFPVCILPGNHDPLARHPLSGQSLPSHVRLLTTDDELYLPDLEMALYPCPPETQSRWASKLKRNPNGARFQVGLAHGSMPTPGKPGDLNSETIAGSGLDYIALGDWHSPRDFSAGETQAWYSGSPEMIMPNQDLPGKILIVEFSETAPPVVEAVAVGEAVPLGSQGVYEMDVASYSDWNELVDSLQARLTPATVAQIKLTGHWQGKEPLDPFQLVEFLNHHCLYAKIESAFHTQPPEPETPFEKEFASWVQQRAVSDPDRQTLYEEAYALGMYLLQGGRL